MFGIGSRRRRVDELGRVVALLQVVNKEKMASVESTRDDVLTSEVDLLNKLDHPNILKIHEVIDTKTKMFIFLELVRDGDLYDKLKREGKLGRSRRVVLAQHAQALRTHRHQPPVQGVSPRTMLEKFSSRWPMQSHTSTAKMCHTAT